MTDDEPRDERLSSRRSIKCICPRCGKKHKLSLFWTGDGIPKKYCKKCQFELGWYTGHCADSECEEYHVSARK